MFKRPDERLLRTGRSVLVSFELDAVSMRFCEAAVILAMMTDEWDDLSSSKVVLKYRQSRLYQFAMLTKRLVHVMKKALTVSLPQLGKFTKWFAVSTLHKTHACCFTG